MSSMDRFKYQHLKYQSLMITFIRPNHDHILLKAFKQINIQGMTLP